MKAVIYEKYGQPEVLQFIEFDKPVPSDSQVLVKIHATTVNRTDCANLTAKPFIMRFVLGFLKPKNPVMGTEFAGEIESVGKNVTTFKPGDKVFGFDDIGLASYAEYTVLSESTAMDTIPKNCSFEQAAASIEGGHYAYNFINKVDINKTHKILVNGASGGIGSATVQLLKNLDTDITAVCNTKNIELVKSLGAKRVIDYTKEDFTNDSEKYDFVFDSVGKSSFGKCKRILKPGGIYISSELGWMIQNLIFFIITSIFGSLPGQKGKKVKFPYPPNIKSSIVYLKKLIEEGKFKSVIDRTYPLDQIKDAFTYVLKGQKTGNVVIKVN